MKTFILRQTLCPVTDTQKEPINALLIDITQILRLLKRHRGAPFLALYQSFMVQPTQLLLPYDTDLDVDYHGNRKKLRKHVGEPY